MKISILNDRRPTQCKTGKHKQEERRDMDGLERMRMKDRDSGREGKIE